MMILTLQEQGLERNIMTTFTTLTTALSVYSALLLLYAAVIALVISALIANASDSDLTLLPSFLGDLTDDEDEFEEDETRPELRRFKLPVKTEHSRTAASKDRSIAYRTARTNKYGAFAC